MHDFYYILLLSLIVFGNAQCRMTRPSRLRVTVASVKQQRRTNESCFDNAYTEGGMLWNVLQKRWNGIYQRLRTRLLEVHARLSVNADIDARQPHHHGTQ